MNRIRSSLRMGLALFAAAIMVTLAACGTGTTIGGAASAASTPALSHFNADLTAGFSLVAGVRTATLAAYNAKALSHDKASAIEDQCTAFTATLKSLQALGDTSSSESAASAQLQAIQSFMALAALEGVVPK